MFRVRTAIIVGLAFLVDATIYAILTIGSGRPEMAGVVMLAVLGVAMGITFAVVVRGSGEL